MPRFSCLLAVSLFFPVTTWAQTAYLERAQQLNLHQHPTWLQLTYRVEGQSDVAAKHFFLTPQGQHHSQDELNAHVQALFTKAQADESVRCRFPARSQWLIRSLNIDVKQLPEVSCPKFENGGRRFNRIEPL